MNDGRIRVIKRIEDITACRSVCEGGMYCASYTMYQLGILCISLRLSRIDLSAFLNSVML